MSANAFTSVLKCVAYFFVQLNLDITFYDSFTCRYQDFEVLVKILCRLHSQLHKAYTNCVFRDFKA